MAYKHILFSIEDGIARLTLNRPERLNSFTAAMHMEVRGALRTIKRNSTVRVLLLTGAGRGFCAGHDLSENVKPAGTETDELVEIVDKYFHPSQHTAEEEDAASAGLGELVSRYYAPLVQALQALPIPVVCAVNGVAAGSGANIALACDIVIAAKSANFVESFCHVGLLPDTGGTYFLPRLIGTARAKGLALLGEKLSAERAESWGLIWKCVPDDRLAAEAEQMARHFAGAATLGLARTKQAFHASINNTLDEQLEIEREYITELGDSADYHEGMAAFAEKRPPRFIGQARAEPLRRRA
ncbi:enoyl-CoA hydratase [Pseudoduganella violaceinigra]|uniref:enoyl-CoA hydratase n=1 Tax=Pseudoduganella violaceinigra TaxID=246602 RepID=UPI0004280AD8|nr:enoyl-CoA hydratase [Pseudoduganella violaceinigra]